MKRVAIGVVVAALVCGLARYSVAQDRPIVAVFDMDGKDAGLSNKLCASLADYLAAKLTESGAFQVIPRSDLKKRLTDEKKGSYKDCVDQSCQIELGRELAAEKTVAAQVLKLGSRCDVTLTVFDLKKAAADSASTDSGKCGEDEIIATLDKALAKLLGGKIAAAPKLAAAPIMDAHVGPAGIVWVESAPAEIEFTKSEVTVAQYRACVEAGKCSAPKSKKDNKDCNWGYSDRDEYPVNCVDWNQATAFCGWAGGRLPTEEEWYAEASNKGTRQYPWGDQAATCDTAVWNNGCGKGSTWPVCSKERGNSVSGLCDMSGNVWEWMSSLFDKEHDWRVLRGGSWHDANPGYLRASYRDRNDPTYRVDVNGFRCGRQSK